MTVTVNKGILLKIIICFIKLTQLHLDDLKSQSRKSTRKPLQKKKKD